MKAGYHASRDSKGKKGLTCKYCIVVKTGGITLGGIVGERRG